MDGFVKVFLDGVNRLGVIVIRFEIAAYHFDNRRCVLFPGWEGKLVRPDGFVPELLSVRLDTLSEQAASALRGSQAAQDVASSLSFECLGKFGIHLDFFLDFPQFLN